MAYAKNKYLKFYSDKNQLIVAAAFEMDYF